MKVFIDDSFIVHSMIRHKEIQKGNPVGQRKRLSSGKISPTSKDVTRRRQEGAGSARQRGGMEEAGRQDTASRTNRVNRTQRECSVRLIQKMAPWLWG